MTLVAFCAWGDGPDVGINVYEDGKYLDGYDLTPAEAERLAYQLLSAATQATRLDREYADYMEQERTALENAVRKTVEP